MLRDCNNMRRLRELDLGVEKYVLIWYMDIHIRGDILHAFMTTFIPARSSLTRNSAKRLRILLHESPRISKVDAGGCRAREVNDKVTNPLPS
jgi:hypothetical protein